MLKKPSAWAPIAMSVAALAVIAAHVAVAGTARQPDEGAAAHLWQMLMAGQVPLIAYFAIRWIPKAPGPALRMLALQVVAVMAACAPVAYFNW